MWTFQSSSPFNFEAIPVPRKLINFDLMPEANNQVILQPNIHHITHYAMVATTWKYFKLPKNENLSSVRLVLRHKLAINWNNRRSEKFSAPTLVLVLPSVHLAEMCEYQVFIFTVMLGKTAEIIRENPSADAMLHFSLDGNENGGEETWVWKKPERPLI